MATYHVLYHPKVVSDDIPSLDPTVRRRIKAAIEAKLTIRPQDHAKPLAFTTQRLWSLRAGPWRIIFALREEEIWILKIGHRSEVYRDLSGQVAPSGP